MLQIPTVAETSLAVQRLQRALKIPQSEPDLHQLISLAQYFNKKFCPDLGPFSPALSGTSPPAPAVVLSGTPPLPGSVPASHGFSSASRTPSWICQIQPSGAIPLGPSRLQSSLLSASHWTQAIAEKIYKRRGL